jgi:hypothetical protein
MRSILFFYLTVAVFAQTTLRVGAAKVDVTPETLPQNYLGVLDRIHSRAIVIDNAGTTAALITVDAGSLPDNIWHLARSDEAGGVRTRDSDEERHYDGHPHA